MPTRTEDVLAAYAAHLRTERHASPHTIRGYLSDLRQFFAFAGAPGAIDRLLATPRGDTLPGLRGRAFLEVLYSSGLRVSELVGLDWEHVDEDAGLLRVLGKGRKERVVPVGRPALRALAAYRARST